MQTTKDPMKNVTNDKPKIDMKVKCMSCKKIFRMKGEYAVQNEKVVCPSCDVVGIMTITNGLLLKRR